jgi:FkbM family methyltransferase
VYSFEPSEQAGHRLRWNLALNSVSNVSVFHGAVGQRAGFEWFFEPQGHLTNGSLVSSFAEKFSADIRRRPCLTVAAGQLTELLGEHRRILLKIDVEGFEAPLLDALAPVIQAKRPDILLEVLPEFEAAINAAAGRACPDYEYFLLTGAGPEPCASVRAGESRDCFLRPRTR